MSDRYARYDQLTLDRPAEGVLRITFDRPETQNAVSEAMHAQLAEIWRDIGSDPEVGVVLVTGAGRAFSAGGDFDLIERIIADPDVRFRVWREARDSSTTSSTATCPWSPPSTGRRWGRGSWSGSWPMCPWPAGRRASSTATPVSAWPRATWR